MFGDQSSIVQVLCDRDKIGVTRDPLEINIPFCDNNCAVLVTLLFASKRGLIQHHQGPESHSDLRRIIIINIIPSKVSVYTNCNFVSFGSPPTGTVSPNVKLQFSTLIAGGPLLLFDSLTFA